MEKDVLPITPYYTPDLVLLEQSVSILVFDVGPLVEELPRVGEAYTVEKMSLWKYGKNNAVAIRMDGFHRARIAGNLYLMTKEQVLELDILHQNGVQFERKKVPVLSPRRDEYGDVPRLSEQPWMYVGKKEHFTTEIAHDQLAHRCGLRLIGNKFEMAPVVLAEDRLLNNHFRLTQSPPFVSSQSTTVNLRVWEHTHKKNTAELQRLIPKPKSRFSIF